MPVVAIILGIVLVDLGFRGTEHEFATQLGEDFGGGQFWAWLAAIAIIGAVGYYSPLKRISNLGIALVVVALVFRNSGVLAQFADVLKSPPKADPSVALPSFTTGGTSGSSAAAAGGSLLLKAAPAILGAL